MLCAYQDFVVSVLHFNLNYILNMDFFSQVNLSGENDVKQMPYM